MRNKVNALVRDCLRSPHSRIGIGKPEPLRESLSGYWSRRIDDTHRLVYRTTTELIIISCRYHY
ncbi:Txe/YoeB family addiction module toxin [Acidithiobacillus ferrooxidans F221]|nr:Txe/YoeB family addiction module toxin [Acidithiobacillus ferrooxidans F221]